MKMIVNCSGNRVGADDSSVVSVRHYRNNFFEAQNENVRTLFRGPRMYR